MPSAQRKPEADSAPWVESRYTMPELVEIRRTMLRYARWLPPGPMRNQRRQIARSLRALFRDPAWLDRNTVEGAPHPRGLHSVVL